MFEIAAVSRLVWSGHRGGLGGNRPLLATPLRGGWLEVREPPTETCDPDLGLTKPSSLLRGVGERVAVSDQTGSRASPDDGART